MVGRRDWTSEEMLICLAYYSSLNKTQRRSPPSWVLNELSKLISRTTGSISLRFANFTSVDPQFTNSGLKGMSGGGAHVQKIWNDCSKNDGELDSVKVVQAIAKMLAASHENFRPHEDSGN